MFTVRRPPTRQAELESCSGTLAPARAPRHRPLHPLAPGADGLAPWLSDLGAGEMMTGL